MKIRHGFVSNSSTSSFILAGIAIDDAVAPDTEEAVISVARDLGITDPEQCFDFFDVLSRMGVTRWYDDEKSLFYVGVSLGDIEDRVIAVDPDNIYMPPDVSEKLLKICARLGIPYKINVYAGTVSS